jgi:mRNA interferase MazF
MISSQLEREIADFDDVVREADPDFPACGLKAASVIRVSRLAVVARRSLLGAIGVISPDRLSRIKGVVADWIRGA